MPVTCPCLEMSMSKPQEIDKTKEIESDELFLQKVKSRQNISDWVNESQQERAELGMEDFMLDRHMLLLLWASQGNTGPASFWLLLFLMKHPDAMEVEEVLRETGQFKFKEKVKSRQNISDWVNESQQERAELGMEDFMLDRHMLLLLWASQGNTGPASFWLLLFLMKHPDAMEAVRGEVEEVLRETGQEVKRGGPLINLTRDMLQRTPILDSAVEETLRMTAAPVLTRAVLEDMTLNMANGQQYNIRMGDRVSLFPYTTVQTDPETQKVNITACPGVSMCTGSIILLMLTYFDLKNPDEEIPDIDLQRLGIGVMHSTKDIQFRYRVILGGIAHCLFMPGLVGNFPSTLGPSPN
ncbi:hypothetical protein P4O66_008764, partial [Electrophorus voltai]